MVSNVSIIAVSLATSSKHAADDISILFCGMILLKTYLSDASNRG